MDEEHAFIRASWVNLVGNLVKLGIEGGIGLAFGSIVLVADAANSFGDVLASLVVLLWGRLSYSDPDRGHPHGHERIEPLAALFVAVAIIVVGFLLLSDAVLTLYRGSAGHFSVVLVGGLGVGIVVKLGQWWYTRRVNRALDSPGLRALGADALSDLYATTAAGIGVFGIAVGYPVLDPLAAVLVSLLILREGGLIAIENTRYLTGAAPPKAIRERIRARARAHSDVLGLHNVEAYYVGAAIEVELRVAITNRHTVEQAQTIETELVERISDIEDVNHVHVRLNPVTTAQNE